MNGQDDKRFTMSASKLACFCSSQWTGLLQQNDTLCLHSSRWLLYSWKEIRTCCSFGIVLLCPIIGKNKLDMELKMHRRYRQRPGCSSHSLPQRRLWCRSGGTSLLGIARVPAARKDFLFRLQKQVPSKPAIDLQNLKHLFSGMRPPEADDRRTCQAGGQLRRRHPGPEKKEEKTQNADIPQSDFRGSQGQRWRRRWKKAFGSELQLLFATLAAMRCLCLSLLTRLERLAIRCRNHKVM